MTSAFFDAGDLQRLDREASLTEQAPRVLPSEDRSPAEAPVDVTPMRDEPDGMDMMLEGLLMVLKENLE